MSTRPYLRGARRNHSGQQRPSGDGGQNNNQLQQQLVSGDSHFDSVRGANQGYRLSGNFSNHHRPYAPRRSPPHYHNPPPPSTYYPRFNQNQQFYGHPPLEQHQQFHRPPPPPSVVGQGSEHNQGYYRLPVRPRGPFQHNQRFRPPQQYGPRRPKAVDYRDWEYAKPGPPPHCERFTILSYNILADYLATTHRQKLYIHIPQYILDWQQRKRSIAFELGLWSADILCFQEVDRFQDLEQELKVHGYTGIWKMRTGDPVDGCAIFWRVSRFKLLHEESIEFNKLGLRDNVAQIFVFESIGCSNINNESGPSTSSTHHNKVVVCNIHVLFNPKRGEIKLGQIRELLHRANSVSKLWDDAPVVVCGDFNCTPKSPCYKYIAEQKLDLSELPRDKVSGQVSAEIPPPRPSISHSGREVITALDSSVANGKEIKEFGSPSDAHNVDHSKIIESSVTSGTGEKTDQNDAEPSRGLYHDKGDNCNGEKKSIHFGTGGSEQTPSISDTEGGSPEFVSLESHQQEKHSGVTHCKNKESSRVPTIATLNVSNHSSDPDPDTNSLETFSKEDGDSTLVESGTGDAMSNKNFVGTLRSDISSTELSFQHSPEDSNQQSLGNLVSVSDVNGKACASTLSGFDVSHEPTTSIELLLDDKMERLSVNEGLEGKEDECLGEDYNTFLSELHNPGSPFRSDFTEVQRSEFDELDLSFKELASNEVLDAIPSAESEVNDAERIAYDSSAWTPEEVKTASGSADCKVMEHPLKLRSVYGEVQDCSGTRDSSGEPLVTSYHRRFLGTVDYIWHSEGLQTVRVLAPIPKHAMQWTPGFPTKKWGSDHIALVSELAFKEDYGSAC